jgi:hypothetical protein
VAERQYKQQNQSHLSGEHISLRDGGQEKECNEPHLLLPKLSLNQPSRKRLTIIVTEKEKLLLIQT